MKTIPIKETIRLTISNGPHGSPNFKHAIIVTMAGRSAFITWTSPEELKKLFAHLLLLLKFL